MEKGCNEKPRIAIPRRNTEVPIPSSTVAIVFDGSRQNGGHFGERRRDQLIIRNEEWWYDIAIAEYLISVKLLLERLPVKKQ